jgi:DNA-binding MarR family transcriptional regulator
VSRSALSPLRLADPVAGTPPVVEGVLGFLRLVWALDHGLQLVSKRMEAEQGITGQQRLVIRILGAESRLSPGQLAELLHLDPSTVSGIIKRLEKRRLVRRTEDPSDGRRVIVELTVRGRALDAPDPRTVEALVERALSVFPRVKIEATEEVLRTLTNILEREVEDDGRTIART